MIHNVKVLDSPDSGRNVGTEIRDRLIADFGFEVARPGRFHRVVDDQHATVITVQPWDNTPDGGTNSAILWLGVARRDMNLLRNALLDDQVDAWWPTVSDARPPSFDPPPDFSYLTETETDVAQWIDDSVPRLLSETTNLPFIRGHLERQRNSSHRATQGFAKRPRMLNSLLDGWSDEAEEEFLVPMIATLDEDWPNDPDKSIRQGRVDRIRAWIAEHPDGVERELTG